MAHRAVARSDKACFKMSFPWLQVWNDRLALAVVLQQLHLWNQSLVLSICLCFFFFFFQMPLDALKIHFFHQQKGGKKCIFSVYDVFTSEIKYISFSEKCSRSPFDDIFQGFWSKFLPQHPIIWNYRWWEKERESVSLGVFVSLQKTI